jgi:hypothetical protein
LSRSALSKRKCQIRNHHPLNICFQGQIKRLVGSAGNLSVHRRELAISSGDLGRASSMLANTEEKQSLSRSLSHLGTLYENLGEIYSDLSDKDLYSFSELLSDQVFL